MASPVPAVGPWQTFSAPAVAYGQTNLERPVPGGSVGAADRVAAVHAGRAALARLATAPNSVEDPLVVVALERLRAEGVEVDPRPLLDYYASRRPHYGRENALRYRWSLSWRAEPGHDLYRGEPAEWRPAEAERLLADPSGYGRRLMTPLTMASQIGFWGSLAQREPDAEIGALATGLLDEAQPAIENDVSQWLLATDPWRDTFGLWVLTAQPHAVTRLRDLLFSLAIRYGGIASRDGVVLGVRHPFHGVPMVSASAHLAAGLWRMGVYPSVMPSLLDLIRQSRRSDGGWADGSQPTDITTTLASAEVLTALDPTFDPWPTVSWFVHRQERDGWWRALGPEVPWLTSAVLGWLDLAERPFPGRFTWPSAPVWARDRLTGLTTVATLDEVGHVLEALPGLAGEPMEVAFLDLAGFGEWNTAHGQDRGDAVMAALGQTLLDIEGVLPVRIGGDEFVVLGKPGATSLPATMKLWCEKWPAALEAASLPANVSPRVIVGRDRAGNLRDLRRRLGDRIGPVKLEHPMPEPTGVLVDL